MPKPARSRDSERYGSASNEYGHGGRWENPKKRVIQGFIQCSNKKGKALKLTSQLIKQAKTFNSLGIKSFEVEKPVFTEMCQLSGSVSTIYEIAPQKYLNAFCTGKGKWVINIVGLISMSYNA